MLERRQAAWGMGGEGSEHTRALGGLHAWGIRVGCLRWRRVRVRFGILNLWGDLDEAERTAGCGCSDVGVGCGLASGVDQAIELCV